MASMDCQHCGYAFHETLERCPHCARPGLYANVIAVEKREEQDELYRRYDAALKDATNRGCAAEVDRLERLVSASDAVIARPLGEMQRLATADNEVYSTFYGLLDAGVRLPKDDDWDVLRRLADESLFPGYREKVRFAALSVDGGGLAGYGDFFMILKSDKIAHRSSVLEENSAIFLKRVGYDVARCRGFRATWNDRGKLAVAKLAPQVATTTTDTELAALVMRSGSTSADDVFIEVHIWGPATIRSVSRVVATRAGRQARRYNRTILAALRVKLTKFGV